MLGVVVSSPAAHAQTIAPDTQYTTVIEYLTTSGYTPENVNVTWTNSNSCGIFSGFGAGATWEYGTGVGTTPCTSSLPSGTITETASADGAVLATCIDAQGASTYGSIGVSASLPECTNTGAGVSINSFFAQAYNAAGNPVAASSGNDDWIIALVVVIILVLALLFFYMRRKRKTTPVATAAQAASTLSSFAPASTARFCRNCGAAVEPGASFCPSCGKTL